MINIKNIMQKPFYCLLCFAFMMGIQTNNALAAQLLTQPNPTTGPSAQQVSQTQHTLQHFFKHADNKHLHYHRTRRLFLIPDREA